MNNSNFVGYLTADPELKMRPKGEELIAILNFSIGIDRGYSSEVKKEKKERGEATSDFPRFTAYGKQAEYISNYGKKGRLVSITGVYRTDKFKAATGETIYSSHFDIKEFKFLDFEASTKLEENDDFFIPEEV